MTTKQMAATLGTLAKTSQTDPAVPFGRHSGSGNPGPTSPKIEPGRRRLCGNALREKMKAEAGGGAVARKSGDTDCGALEG
jgi:hypothetical protein